MESTRLLIRPMREADEAAFTAGISDRALRIAYGFPEKAEPSVSSQIFRNFLRLSKAYSIIEKNEGNMVGFLLDVDPELPEELAAGLPEKGRTLAFAVFPPFQRQGYMREILKTYVSCLFEADETDYIHCGHFTDNEPSRRLLRGLGFHKYASHAFQNRVIEDEILFR